MQVFCFGIGYVGLEWLKSFSPELAKKGTTTTPTKLTSLKKYKITPYLFQGKKNKDITFEDITHLLVTIPPASSGDSVLTCYQDLLIRSSSLQWIGILSSTGVYGDHQGKIVTEESVCLPTSSNTQARLDSEKRWLDLSKTHYLPVHIFRLAGIYGSGRTLIDAVLTNTIPRLNKPGHLFSRIHLEDILQTLEASMNTPQPGSIYNLADDHPTTTREIIDYICCELNHPLPPLIEYESAEISPTLRNFYQDNKVVSNTKIKSELKIKLKYPSYREGLKNELEGLKRPQSFSLSSQEV